MISSAEPVDTKSAGLRDTRPSPIDRIVKVRAASPIDMPRSATPMTMPPTTLIARMSRPATASPRTNFDAPSIAPWKSASRWTCSRRARASFSLISPAPRLASIAICLPGIESRVKRAATSEMRSAPLVITTKFTITRIRKMIAPTMKSPPIANRPNAAITAPAACSPCPPWVRISRVEATLSDSRNSVTNSSSAGNDEKSVGRST